MKELKPEDCPKGMTLRHTLRGHKAEINGLDWSPDGSRLASTSHDNTIRLWDLEKGNLIKTLEGHTSSPYRACWSLDGNRLASSSDERTIRLWDTKDGKHIKTLEAYDSYIFSVCWSPDGSVLASGLGDGVIELWDTKKWKLIKTLSGHRNQVNDLSWTPDGSVLASCSFDKTIRLWDPLNGETIRILEGHKRPVCSIAWSLKGNFLASASFDHTIRTWESKSGRLLNILEGHTGKVESLSFSFDGRLLASKSKDDTVRIWDLKTLKTTAILNETTDKYSLPMLSFHPHKPILATLGEKDRDIRIWDLNFDRLSGYKKTATQYKNAKVVLVGDSGVGKTGLGLVLSGKKYERTDSTHGRHVWSFDSHEAKLNEYLKEKREILLWDLAGQPGYRLIHQLHLDEVSLALVVFDAKNETDPFAGVTHWSRALKLAEKRTPGETKESNRAMKKILVLARADRGGVGASKERIEKVKKEWEFVEYFETSAKEGLNIKKLTAFIKESVDWDLLPGVISTELFQKIQDFIKTEKNEGRLLSTVDDLHRTFKEKDKTGVKEDLKAEFRTCIGRLEAAGLIRKLSFGNFVLLQPELLDAYASAIVNEAKNEPDGMGCIHEQDVKDGKFSLSKEERIKDREQERLLLLSTIEDLLNHEICLREETEDGPHLIFPSQFTRENPDMPDPEGKSLIFSFEGPVLNIYTTLVVRLTHSGLFNIMEGRMWKNAVEFSAAGGGKYGVYLNQIEDGKAELVLFFSEKASEETRFQFEEYIKNHLQRRALMESIIRRRIFICPAEDCKETITDSQARKRVKRGHKSILCPVCETKIDLRDGEERLDGKPIMKTAEMDASADKLRRQEKAKTILQGKKATDDYDVFLAYNSKDRLQVEKINEDLKKRGINTWIDKERIPQGRWFQDFIQKAIPNAGSAVIFIGPHGLGRWQTLELKTFISQCVEEGIPVIPTLLPGVKEIPKNLLFLKELNPVRFDKDVAEEETMKRLVWGITGERGR